MTSAYHDGRQARDRGHSILINPHASGSGDYSEWEAGWKGRQWQLFYGQHQAPAVYLAGKMAGCNDAECRDWREKAKTLLEGIEVHDPMVRDFRGVEMTLEQSQQLVQDDKTDIDRCFAVVVRADGGPSWGTAMELIYAHEQRKFTAVFVGETRNSPWVVAHASVVVRTVEEACAAVQQEVKGWQAAQAVNPAPPPPPGLEA